MKKFLLLFLLMPSIAMATLTAGNVPVTKTGGSSPSLQNSDISDVVGTSASIAVPLTIDGVTYAYGNNSGTAIQVQNNGAGCLSNIGPGSLDSNCTLFIEPASSYNVILAGGGGDVFTNAWADYSTSSTISGFASISSKYIYTYKIGKMVFVNFYILGTSNAPSITFTLPYTSATGPTSNGWITWITNSTSGYGSSALPTASSTVTCYTTAAGAGFTNGTSSVAGQFWYHST